MEFDELVEHLDDLIALTRSERFERFAQALEGARQRALGSFPLFSVRDTASSPASSSDPDAARDSRFPRNVRDS